MDQQMIAERLREIVTDKDRPQWRRLLDVAEFADALSKD